MNILLKMCAKRRKLADGLKYPFQSYDQRDIRDQMDKLDVLIGAQCAIDGINEVTAYRLLDDHNATRRIK